GDHPGARTRPRPGLGDPGGTVARRPHRAGEPVGPGRQGRGPDDGHPRGGTVTLDLAPVATGVALPDPPAAGPMEQRLRTVRESGRKLLIPYLTGGLGPWTELVRAVADAGADAVEIGIPFSDPVMDGPTIQVASEQ